MKVYLITRAKVNLNFLKLIKEKHFGMLFSLLFTFPKSENENKIYPSLLATLFVRLFITKKWQEA